MHIDRGERETHRPLVDHTLISEIDWSESQDTEHLGTDLLCLLPWHHSHKLNQNKSENDKLQLCFLMCWLKKLHNQEPKKLCRTGTQLHSAFRTETLESDHHFTMYLSQTSCVLGVIWNGARVTVDNVLAIPTTETGHSLAHTGRSPRPLHTKSPRTHPDTSGSHWPTHFLFDATCFVSFTGENSLCFPTYLFYVGMRYTSERERLLLHFVRQ